MRLLALLAILITLGCNNSKTKPPDYCAILQADQKNVNYDKSDANYLKDKFTRHSNYQRNFKVIMRYVEANGFPEFILNESNNDNCKYNAITMTFIHIAQSNINTFYQPQTKILLTKECKSNPHVKS